MTPISETGLTAFLRLAQGRRGHFRLESGHHGALWLDLDAPALQAAGAMPVVAGAVLVLGGLGAGYFAQQHLPLAAVLREDCELWTPAACPMCLAGQPLEDPGSGAI